MKAVVFLAAAGTLTLAAQTNFFYKPADATGRLVRTAVTNVSQPPAPGLRKLSVERMATASGAEVKLYAVQPKPRAAGVSPKAAGRFAQREAQAAAVSALPVAPAVQAFTFAGLTHYDQRNANQGNQFSIEPPNPEVAAANGWILEGVNNAIQVYSANGTPLLPRVLSTNELFQVPPAIDRLTYIQGVYPTDMRVFYDHGIDRWFVVQRAQDFDAAGFPLASSHLYLAVSQTGSPLGSYNIYTMETTSAQRPGCPCFSDFPQIGADQYGIYISADQYDSFYGYFAGASILAIQKTALATGAVTPRVVEFSIPRQTVYAGTIRPAITPPGASYALSRGGIEFFLSTNSSYASDSSFALWALTNTASLNTTPDLLLIQAVIPGVPYVYPDAAPQKPGFLAYGSSLFPPGQLALIDGGKDSRILSLQYAAGRLFATFSTDTLDDLGRRVVGAGYAVMFPYLRGDILAAPIWRGGHLVVRGNHLLRPAAAVNASGRGAIAMTLAGPDYFPSAAFVAVDGFVPGAVVQVAAPGTGPQDGFTGYPEDGSRGIARWGDYSSAVALMDGSIWMTAEYIPGGMRTELANWGTRVYRYGP